MASAFDLPDKDYSWMAYLAEAGDTVIDSIRVIRHDSALRINLIGGRAEGFV